MNLLAIRAIYLFEMHRAWRTLTQSIISPVISTSLYFVVFGSAIGPGRPFGSPGSPGRLTMAPGLAAESRVHVRQAMRSRAQSIRRALFSISLRADAASIAAGRSIVCGSPAVIRPTGRWDPGR